MKKYDRIPSLGLSAAETCFLWGARQTGKSTLLKTKFPEAKVYDLLLSHEYARLIRNPGLLREECDAANLTGDSQKYPIIIDEVQKVPTILDEVHWLIENRGLRFILCGSSARKLRRKHANLLGGRAVRYELFPLVSAEVPGLCLESALNNGMLPRHYVGKPARRLIQSYVDDYLREEIAAEALVRNVPSFSRFLEVAALSNGEMINYTTIARECGVSAPAVKEYYQILKDTLIGDFLPAFSKRMKRRLVTTPRFYFFDVGVVAHLTRRGIVQQGSELFGRAFEHFVLREVLAHSHYSESFYPLAYWRTASQFEVDLVLGDHEVVVEIKSCRQVNDNHLKGVRAFKEEYVAKRYIVVSMDTNPRRTSDGIEILPWRVFLCQLWNNGIIVS